MKGLHSEHGVATRLRMLAALLIVVATLFACEDDVPRLTSATVEEPDTTADPVPAGKIAAQYMPPGFYALTQIAKNEQDGIFKLRKAARDRTALKGVILRIAWSTFENEVAGSYNTAFLDAWVAEMDDWSDNPNARLGFLIFANTYTEDTSKEAINMPVIYRNASAYGGDGGAGAFGTYRKFNTSDVFKGYTLALDRDVGESGATAVIRERFKEAMVALVEHMVRNHPNRFAGILFDETAHAGKQSDGYDANQFMDGYEDVMLAMKDTLTVLNRHGYGIFSGYNFLSGTSTDTRRAQHIQFLIDNGFGISGPDTDPTNTLLNDQRQVNDIFFSQTGAKRAYRHLIPTLNMYQTDRTGAGGNGSLTGSGNVYTTEDLNNWSLGPQPGYTTPASNWPATESDYADPINVSYIAATTRDAVADNDWEDHVYPAIEAWEGTARESSTWATDDLQWLHR